MKLLSSGFSCPNTLSDYGDYETAEKDQKKQKKFKKKIDDELDQILLTHTDHDLNLDKISSGFEYLGKEWISKLHKETIAPYKLSRSVQVFNQKISEISSFFELVQVVTKTDVRKSFSEIYTLTKADVDMIAASLFLDKIKENIAVLEEIKKIISKEMYIINNKLPKLLESVDELEVFIKENISKPELTDNIQYLQSFLSFHQMKNEGFVLLIQSAEKAFADYTRLVEFVIPQYLAYIDTIEMDLKVQNKTRDSVQKEEYKQNLTRHFNNAKDSAIEIMVISNILAPIFSMVCAMVIQKQWAITTESPILCLQIFALLVTVSGCIAYQKIRHIKSVVFDYLLCNASFLYLGFTIPMWLNLSRVLKPIPTEMLIGVALILFVVIACLFKWVLSKGQNLIDLHMLSSKVFDEK